MEEQFQHKYRIPSTRMQKWDYGWRGAYFITICTEKRKMFFGNIVDNVMVLNKLGMIADLLWNEIIHHTKGVELGEFVVMPNHVHGILILTRNADEINTDHINTHHINTVETRHALSLQSNQSNQSNALNPLHPSDPSHPSTPTNVDISGISNDSEPATLPVASDETIGQQRFQNQGKNTISSMVGGYKSAVTKYAHRYGFDFGWQSRFYDIIIRDVASFDRISDYIRNNPENWNQDKFYA
jgi:putative transposase